MIMEFSGYSRAMLGERHNGDRIFLHQEGGRIVLSVIDGIGHGGRASEISDRIKGFLDSVLDMNPSEMIARTHEYMVGSEGAALGIAVIEKDKLIFASLGNVSCFVRGRASRTLVSTDGLLGVRGRTAKKDTVRLEVGDLVVMHSDGISGPGIVKKETNPHLYSAKALARKIVKDHGSPFDDASVILVKVKDED